VQAVFLNLFGGILSCERVARAMRGALGDQAPAKPVVVRMAGTKSAEGLACLREMDVEGLHLAGDMTESFEILRGLGPVQDTPQRIEPARDVDLKPIRIARTPAPGRPLELDASTPVLVQGATGRAALLHTGLMLEYGANVVAGVTPFKGGQTTDSGVPVYDSVAEARGAHDIGASIVFVPGPFAVDAVLEAVDAGIPWVVCITEGVEQLAMLRGLERIRRSGVRLVGPNTPGVIVPGETKIGILPAAPFSPGPLAVFSRSGTLTYEAAARLTAAGYGQRYALGVGGDPFVGLSFADCLAMAGDDDAVRGCLVIGEIGGSAEEEMAAWIARTGFAKPVFAFVAGLTAPPGRRLGHAGAILDEAGGSVERKLGCLAAAGVHLCEGLDAIAPTVRRVLG
jgi:succinyl-CoA synthetase alpha subunit